MSALTLEQWRELLGYHPWHFWQQSDSTYTPLNSRCNTLVYEQAWMDADAVGRAQIRDAIATAEGKLTEWLGFDLLPTYHEAMIQHPRPGDARLEYRYRSIDARGRWLSVHLPHSEIIAIGVETDTTPETVNLTYSDTDGDGLIDTAICSATVPSGTTAEQVVARFSTGDYVGDYVEVAPRLVTVSGVTATLVFNSYELVKPTRYRGVNQAPVNPTVVPGTAYAATLDVLRRYINQDGDTLDTAGVVLIWETRPCPEWACLCDNGTNDTDPAALAYAVARGNVRDASAGIVAIGEARKNDGVWAAIDWSVCRQPDRVIVRYTSGLERGRVLSTAWREVVGRLAAAELTRPVCGCVAANKELYEWQTDLSRTGQNATDLFQAPEDLTNPFGARRGHIQAWRYVQRFQRGYGIGI